MARLKGSQSTSELRREESRKNILRAALKLFFTKGYEKTTTRDIIMETGILNGSLYNRFKSKDDILFNIISDAIVGFLNGSEKLMIKENDPVKALMLPMAIELYIASKSQNLADLIFQAHKSWDAIDRFIGFYRDWLKTVWTEHFHDRLDEEALRMGLTSIIGAVGNICGEYAHGYKGDYREVMEGLLKVTVLVTGAPFFEVKKTVTELADYVEHGDVRICDYRISDLEQLCEGQTL